MGPCDGHCRQVAALDRSFCMGWSAAGASSSDHNRDVAALNSDYYGQVLLNSNVCVDVICVLYQLSSPSNHSYIQIPSY